MDIEEINDEKIIETTPTPRPRSNRNTAFYNAFAPCQLDDMVHEWYAKGRLSHYHGTPCPTDDTTIWVCTYAKNPKYCLAHISVRWIKKWKEQKLTHIPCNNQAVCVVPGVLCLH